MHASRILIPSYRFIAVLQSLTTSLVNKIWNIWHKNCIIGFIFKRSFNSIFLWYILYTLLSKLAVKVFFSKCVIPYKPVCDLFYILEKWDKLVVFTMETQNWSWMHMHPICTKHISKSLKLGKNRMSRDMFYVCT
jgi:hypothetical protein